MLANFLHFLKKIINPKTILDDWAGRIEKPKMLCEEFRADNEKYRQRLEIGDVGLNTVLRNERVERYLGEMAGICGINKPLTMHIAPANVEASVGEIG